MRPLRIADRHLVSHHIATARRARQPGEMVLDVASQGTHADRLLTRVRRRPYGRLLPAIWAIHVGLRTRATGLAGLPVAPFGCHL
jgi:hypothetical protein